LVSNYSVESTRIFGIYVDSLFQEKAKQYAYKSTDDILYNPSYRETIKLYLNAVTGKLVMDKAKYNSVEFVNEEKIKDLPTKYINGNTFYVNSKTADKSQNIWINAGCMVYSYSKRLLFDYIKLLPDNSNNVIHVETGSIYFPLRCKEHLIKAVDNYAGPYPIAFGNALGNIKVEKETTQEAYFLNKKVYHIENSNIMKGIPSSSIEENGTKKEIINKAQYERIYNHKIGDEPITVKYMTMQKKLFGNTCISSHIQTRTINSSHDYKEYN
jgi:hypothetical protein